MNGFDALDVIQRSAERAASETPCEAVARYRQMHEMTGQDFSPLLARTLEQELHQEAADAGRPCPCGREFAPVVIEGGQSDD